MRPLRAHRDMTSTHIPDPTPTAEVESAAAPDAATPASTGSSGDMAVPATSADAVHDDRAVAAPSPDEPVVSDAAGNADENVAPASLHVGAPVAPIREAGACAQQLKERWPALFSGAPKPLKLRIQVDIQERAPGVFTKQALSAFFRRHTGSTSYLQAVAKGGARFDLDGQPSGEITPEHRQAARDELARRRANQEARLALEEQQRRNRAGLLHDYERTTLTRANFCVLKGVAEAELDGLLAIAREEAAQRRPAPPDRGSERALPPRGARHDGTPPARDRGGPEGRRSDPMRKPERRDKEPRAESPAAPASKPGRR